MSAIPQSFGSKSVTLTSSYATDKGPRLADVMLCPARKAPSICSAKWAPHKAFCTLTAATLTNAALCVWPAAATTANWPCAPEALCQATDSEVTSEVTWHLPVPPQLPVPGRPWLPCQPRTSCVSTNSIMSPAQYMPPWSFSPDSRQTAFKSVMAQLQENQATVLEADPDAGYIAAQLPTSSNCSDYDTLQLLLQPDGVVLFKSQAKRSKPDPPFCLTPGCISGPSNRNRLDVFRDALGWTVLETDEDKEWVQILMH